MLSRSNVDKSEVQTQDTQHRLAMMQCMAGHVASNSSLDLAVVWTDAPRFIDKARLLREHLPGTALSFVVGLDTLNRFFLGKYYGLGDQETDRLASLLDSDFFGHGHRLLVAPRSMEQNVQSSQISKDWMPLFYSSFPVAERFRKQIISLHLDHHLQTISSTAVRQACHEGHTEQYQCMVLPSVAAYIEKERLYR